MQNLSVVIITLNEERNIGRCLESVQKITDDIVVMDSGSADRTEDICRAYPNVNFQKTVWKGYSETKNQAAAFAKYDFILSLDADEVVSEKLEQSLLSMLHADCLKGAYSMNRLTNYCGSWIKHTSWYPDTKIRIWNKNEGRWEGDLHEKVEFSRPVAVSHLKGDLLHYSYYSVADHVRKIDGYTSLGAKVAFEKGKKASLLKLIFSGPVRFFKDYFIKLGFLDGYAGFQVAKMSAFLSYLKYAKLRDMYRLNIKS